MSSKLVWPTQWDPTIIKGRGASGQGHSLAAEHFPIRRKALDSMPRANELIENGQKFHISLKLIVFFLGSETVSLTFLRGWAPGLPVYAGCVFLLLCLLEYFDEQRHPRFQFLRSSSFSSLMVSDLTAPQADYSVSMCSYLDCLALLWRCTDSNKIITTHTHHKNYTSKAELFTIKVWWGGQDITQWGDQMLQLWQRWPQEEGCPVQPFWERKQSAGSPDAG